MAVIEKLNISIDRYLRIQLLLTHGTAQATDDHRAILAACRKRDGALAAKLLKRHILEAGRNLVRCLQQERAIAAAEKQKT